MSDKNFKKAASCTGEEAEWKTGETGLKKVKLWILQRQTQGDFSFFFRFCCCVQIGLAKQPTLSLRALPPILYA